MSRTIAWVQPENYWFKVSEYLLKEKNIDIKWLSNFYESIDDFEQVKYPAIITDIFVAPGTRKESIEPVKSKDPIIESMMNEDTPYTRYWDVAIRLIERIKETRNRDTPIYVASCLKDNPHNLNNRALTAGATKIFHTLNPSWNDQLISNLERDVNRFKP